LCVFLQFLLHVLHDLCLQVEIQARKVFCISKAEAQLPLNLEDTARSECELGKIVKEK
jgi:hypothetical protein